MGPAGNEFKQRQTLLEDRRCGADGGSFFVRNPDVGEAWIDAATALIRVGRRLDGLKHYVKAFTQPGSALRKLKGAARIGYELMTYRPPRMLNGRLAAAG